MTGRIWGNVAMAPTFWRDSELLARHRSLKCVPIINVCSLDHIWEPYASPNISGQSGQRFFKRPSSKESHPHMNHKRIPCHHRISHVQKNKWVGCSSRINNPGVRDLYDQPLERNSRLNNVIYLSLSGWIGTLDMHSPYEIARVYYAGFHVVGSRITGQ
jgi:hypothetical protein